MGVSTTELSLGLKEIDVCQAHMQYVKETGQEYMNAVS